MFVIGEFYFEQVLCCYQDRAKSDYDSKKMQHYMCHSLFASVPIYKSTQHQRKIKIEFNICKGRLKCVGDINKLEERQTRTLYDAPRQRCRIICK